MATLRWSLKMENSMRDFVSIHDIVRANMLAMESARSLMGEVINM